MAGCPLVNNSTYISQTGAEFLTICSTSILAEPSGQNVDLSNSIQSSFDSCLNACAAANGCVGATWYMFHPTTPSYNSRCFLKNGTGQEVVASGGLSVVSGYLKSALPPWWLMRFRSSREMRVSEAWVCSLLNSPHFEMETMSSTEESFRNGVEGKPGSIETGDSRQRIDLFGTKRPQLEGALYPLL